MFKNVLISKVEMVGFKGFRERTVVEFNQEGITTIQADNYKGKTSVGEAIAWVFLGSNLWGNDKVDTTLLNDKSKAMRVSIDFIAEEEGHTLTRTRQGSSTTVMLDNRIVKQSELAELVGSKDIFLSIFNPEYFNGMSDKDGRDFLISILGQIPKEDVLGQLDPMTTEALSSEIEYVHIDPNSFMKQKRAEIKELEKDILFAEGSISELHTFVNSEDLKQEPKEFDTNRVEELEKRLEELVVENYRDDKSKKMLKELGEQKHKKEIELNSLLHTQAQVEDIKELRSIKDSLATVTNEQIVATDSEKQEIILLESKLQELREQYRKEKEMPLEKGDTCPTCKTVISQAHMTILEEEREHKLMDLKEQGNACGKKLSELKERVEKTIKELTTIRERKIDELKEKYEARKNSLEKEIKERTVALENEIIKLNHEIIELEKDMEQKQKDKTEKTLEARRKIKDQLFVLTKGKAEIDSYNLMLKHRYEEAVASQQRIMKLQEEVNNHHREIALKKTQVDAAKQYVTAKANILSELIHRNLTDVSISLQKVVKSTGELKDCFEINYKGRGMKVLSTSEKIRTGLEISTLIINQLGLNYPIFVDNKESLTHYNAPDVQIIEAKVVKGAEITVVNEQEKIAV